MRKIKGSPQPFGVDIKGKNINFAVQVAKGKTCELLLYKRGKEVPEYQFDMPEEEGVGEVRFLSVEGLKADRYEYNFLIDGKVCVDPYVKELAGKEKFGVERKLQEHQIRGKIVSMEDYDWQEDQRLHLPWEDVVAYGLHVRGFTKHSSSKVVHKGTFQGVVEKLDYLKELGVNQIQCMPVYEFDEIIPNPAYQESLKLRDNGQAAYLEEPAWKQRINYWGFGDGETYYMAPKAAYAKDPQHADRELKLLIRQLHKNGIEIILQMYFSPRYTQGYIREVLRYWVSCYHVDGFHLMGEGVPAQMLAGDPALSGTKLWHYSFDTEQLYDPAVKPEYRNLAEYRDDYLYTMRRFLKGDDNMLSGVLYEMRHIPANMGRIHYLSNYYGFTLMDMVSYDHKHNEANGEGNRDGNDYNCSWNCGEEGTSRRKKVLALRQKQLQNAFCMLLLTQSTPLIFMGDEFGNSQQGNNNPYCQDNKITWLNWQDKEKNAELLNFWKQMIAFRKAHPILHPVEELRILDSLSCGYPDLSYHGQNAWRPQTESYNRHVGIMYCGKYAKTPQGGEDSFLYVAMNMHWEPQKLAFPKLPKGMEWNLVLATEKAEDTLTVQEKEEQSREQTGIIAPRSIAVYEGVVMAASQDKEKKVSARSLKKKTDAAGER